MFLEWAAQTPSSTIEIAMQLICINKSSNPWLLPQQTHAQSKCVFIIFHQQNKAITLHGFIFITQRKYRKHTETHICFVLSLQCNIKQRMNTAFLCAPSETLIKAPGLIHLNSISSKCNVHLFSFSPSVMLRGMSGRTFVIKNIPY